MVDAGHMVRKIGEGVLAHRTLRMLGNSCGRRVRALRTYRNTDTLVISAVRTCHRWGRDRGSGASARR